MEEIPTEDPAFNLWQKITPVNFSSIRGFLDQVPVPVGQIAEALKLEVISLTLPSDISGLIKRVSQDPSRYQIQVNNTDVAVRQRFTVAHEIAHYLIHTTDIDLDGITDTILYRSKLSDRKEAEANRLAAALLLPWTKVREWHLVNFGCEPLVDNIDEIAKAFRVSSLAVGFRLRL